MFDLYSMYTEKRFTRELSDFLFLALNLGMSVSCQYRK